MMAKNFTYLGARRPSGGPYPSLTAPIFYAYDRKTGLPRSVDNIQQTCLFLWGKQNSKHRLMVDISSILTTDLCLLNSRLNRLAITLDLIGGSNARC